MKKIYLDVFSFCFMIVIGFLPFHSNSFSGNEADELVIDTELVANRKSIKKRRPFTSSTLLQSHKQAKTITEVPSSQIKGGDYYEYDDVTLQEGKGSQATRNSKEGKYWHIFADGKKAGKIFINLINTKPFGEHASIQLFLNQAMQCKHIGRYAYQKACEVSPFNEIYAYMRKSNIASKKAAIAAGFVIVANQFSRQLTLLWSRKK